MCIHSLTLHEITKTLGGRPSCYTPSVDEGLEAQVTRVKQLGELG